MKIQTIKKNIAILILAVMPLSAASQSKARVLQLPDFRGKKAVWVIRAGAGFNKAVGSNKETQQEDWDNGDWDGSFKSSTGYDFTIGFSKSFGGSPLYWGMEVGLSTRGYKTSATWEKSLSSSVSGGTDYHGKFQDVTLLCHMVKFSPFMIGYRYEFLGNMAADIHLGAYASYDYAGKNTVDYTDHIVSTSKYGNRNDKTTTSTETKLNDLDGMRKYDAGMTLGVGYWFGRFNIDFTWQRGFISMNDDGDQKVKIGKNSREKGNLYANSFQLKLGYAF